jgi:hypothetical protein
MFSATPDLLGKVPNDLPGVKGTEAYSMEARQLRHEEHCRYVTRGVSLVVAFLLCLGVFLQPSPVTGSEVPSAVTMADLPSVELLANGNGYPLDGTNLVAPVVEAEGSDKDPLNAELLTMLLLKASFGAIVGWLLTNAQRQGALCSFAVVGPSLASACEGLPFLGVFRL